MTEQRKLAAVMFTDIAGYTALMSKDEQKALAVLEKNRTLQKDLSEKHNGEFLKEMGDGTLLCFQSALEAVRCAMEIQEFVKEDPDLNLRIGIHLGDIVFKEGDVFGDGVNVASRIEHLADAGGICISEQIHLLVRNQQEINASFLDEKKLKNVDHPVKIYTLSIGGSERPHLKVATPKKEDTEETSIIVLPFADLSPNKDNEYFSDGLTEEIITDLSYLQNLLVISRSSAMTFKGSRKRIKEIAQEVNVRYILEGSVRKAGNRLRITAQLIDAKTDTHLWADKYNGSLEDIFGIQERVSQSIFEALKLKLTPEEKQKISSFQIENLHAYECYLRAKHECWKYTPESFDEALKLLNKGIDIIGDNVLLLSSIGTVYLFYIDLGEEPEGYSKKAEEIAEKILDLEPDSSHAHRILATIYWYKDKNKANKHFKKALNADPNNPDLLAWYGWVLSLMWGKPSNASPLVERLLRIDPITPVNNLIKTCWHIGQGQFDLGLESAEKYLKMEPNNILAKSCCAEALGFTQNYDQAIELCDQMIHDEPEHIFAFIFQFMKFVFLGEREKALRLVEEDPRSKLLWEDAEKSREIAEGFSLLREKDKSIDWLENAIKRGNINYPLFNEFDPHLENIRGEERYKKLMERLKKEWENFKV